MSGILAATPHQIWMVHVVGEELLPKVVERTRICAELAQIFLGACTGAFADRVQKLLSELKVLVPIYESRKRHQEIEQCRLRASRDLAGDRLHRREGYKDERQRHGNRRA